MNIKAPAMIDRITYFNCDTSGDPVSFKFLYIDLPHIDELLGYTLTVQGDDDVYFLTGYEDDEGMMHWLVVDGCSGQKLCPARPNPDTAIAMAVTIITEKKNDLIELRKPYVKILESLGAPVPLNSPHANQQSKETVH